MIIQCAWCGKNMGEKPPLEDKSVTHGSLRFVFTASVRSVPRRRGRDKMAFHFKDRWYFERLNQEGDVRIYREEKEADPAIGLPEYEFCIDIDAASWASIVASVSKLGETAEAYQKAVAHHQGDLS